MEETAASHVVQLTDATYDAEVRQFPGLVLVDYWADWCHPCHIMAPRVEELAAKFARNDQVKIAKLNVDEHAQTAMDERVMSLPTFKLFKGGELIDEMVGAGSPDALEQFLMKHVGSATPAAA